MSISWKAPSPSSPTQRTPVAVSNHIRRGLRRPHAQISGRATPELTVEGSTSQAAQERTEVALKNGLSDGACPSRSTLRIFPLPLVRQVANQPGVDPLQAPS